MKGGTTELQGGWCIAGIMMVRSEQGMFIGTISSERVIWDLDVGVLHRFSDRIRMKRSISI